MSEKVGFFEPLKGRKKSDLGQGVQMKFFLVYLSLSFTFSFSLDGFWGIPWGTTKEKATEMMLGKENTTFSSEEKKSEMLIFKGGKFGGVDYEASALIFISNRLCKGVLLFKPLDAKVIPEYEGWVKKINEKYGPATRTQRTFQSPYTEGDGLESFAISIGKGSLVSLWEIKESNGSTNAIAAQINTGLQIVISYESGPLISEYVKRKEDEAKKDF